MGSRDGHAPGIGFAVRLPARLRPPLVPSDYVAPARAIERLRRRATWTLVHAPSGYGKTSLAALSSPRASSVWLRASSHASLASVAKDLASGLATFSRDAAAPLALWLDAGAQDELAVDVFAEAIEEAGSANALTLVVDDLHGFPENFEALLGRLVALPIEGADWILTTRRPPAWLSTLGSVVDLLGVEDLRLDDAEVEAALSHHPVSSSLRASLVARIAGWPAGLAWARSVLGAALDPEEAAQQLAKDPLHWTEQFRARVLDELDGELRRFVLGTVWLPPFDPALAAVALGSAGPTPEDARRAGLFLERSSSDPPLYRYHALFREALLPDARDGLEPGAVARVVSELEARGELDDAFHLVAELSPERVDEFVLRHAPRSLRAGDVRLCERLLDALSDGASRLPDVLLLRAWCAMLAFRWPEAAALTRELEHAPEMAVSPRLRGERDAIAGALVVADDPERGLMLLQSAERALPESSSVRAVVSGERGVYLSAFGTLDEAERHLRSAVDAASRHGLEVVERSARWHLAELAAVRGRAREAEAAHRVALSIGVRRGPHVARVGLAAMCRQRRALDEGREHLREALQEARRAGSAAMLAQALVECARTEAALEHFDDAQRWIDEVRRIAVRTARRDWTAAIDAYAALFAWRATGLLPAEDVVRSWPDRPYPLFLADHPVEHVALVKARFEVARGDLERALAGLEVLDRSASDAGRIRSQIEIALIRGCALTSSGDPRGAFVLARACEWAESLGFRSSIVEEKSKSASASDAPRSVASVPSVSPVPSALVPSDCLLSSRELEVLALAAEGRTNATIAKVLFIAPSTVKRHLENVYARLQADNRRHAVSIAREKGWIP